MRLTDMLQRLEPGHHKLRDMTPAQIALHYGAGVADYIVELRTAEKFWKDVANDRAGEPVRKIK